MTLFAICGAGHFSIFLQPSHSEEEESTVIDKIVMGSRNPAVSEN